MDTAGTIPSITVMGGAAFSSGPMNKIIDIVSEMDKQAEVADDWGEYTSRYQENLKSGNGEYIPSGKYYTDIKNNKSPNSVVSLTVRIGHTGVDITVGSEGDDTLTYENSSFDWVTNRVHGGGGDDVISISSTALGSQLAFGGEGNDTISISAAMATAVGGAGDDMIAVAGYSASARGGAGDDVITVSGQTVKASGGSGDDTITVNGRGDVGPVWGGEGDDLIIVSGNVVKHVTGNQGNDTITVSGNTVGRVDGGDGDDVINVSTNNEFDDWTNYDHNMSGGLGYTGFENPTTIDGGQGNDVINIDGKARVIHRAGDGQDVITVSDTTEIVTFGDDWFDDVLLLDEATFSYADGELTVTFEGRDDKMTIRAAEGEELSWELTSDRTFMITVNKAADASVDTEASVDVEVEQDDQAD
ncbi:MAG: hypothetical protein JKY83_07035 [Rhizobiaceae bacterium]|nr:hypothetical protein [Rhizobiaceae bacterium]